MEMDNVQYERLQGQKELLKPVPFPKFYDIGSSKRHVGRSRTTLKWDADSGA
jgi:hypothetical protein